MLLMNQKKKYSLMIMININFQNKNGINLLKMIMFKEIQPKLYKS